MSIAEYTCYFISCVRKVCSIMNRYFPLIAINEYVYVLVCLPLKLHGIEPTEFEMGSKVATDVGVDRNTRHWRDGSHNGFPCTWILSDTTEWSSCNAYFIFRVVPFHYTIFGKTIPHEPEIKSFPAGECFFHLIIHWLDLDLVCAHIYIERLVGITALDLRYLVGELLQH